MRYSTLLAAFLGSASCTESPQPSSVPIWIAVETHRIGELEGQVTFSAIQDLALTRDASVFVREPDQIRLFSSTGLIRHVAGHGLGPGEISRPNGMLLGTDDTLRVIDPEAGRVSLFEPSGSFSRSFPITFFRHGVVWEGTVDRFGNLIDPLSQSYVRVVSSTGHSRDSTLILRCNPKTRYRQRSIMLGTEDNYSMVAIRHQARPQTVFTADRTAWCTPTDEYLIVRSRLGTSDTMATITKATPPLPVPDSERSRLIAFCRTGRAPDGSPCDESSIPRVKPIVEQIGIDLSGRLWVRPTSSQPATPVFDVFDVNGKQLARACFPIFVRGLPQARGDTIAAITRDSATNVESVVWFELRRDTAQAPAAHCLTKR